jgi:hypothetical protein
MIFDDKSSEWTEPTSKERESCLGIMINATDHLEESEEQRCHLLGNSFDQQMFSWIFAQLKRSQGLVFAPIEQVPKIIAYASEIAEESPGPNTLRISGK